MDRPSLTSPTRRLTVLAAALLVTMAGVLALSSQASAAKPCWEQVIDDWLDNGRIDGVYSSRCLEQARENLPEDIRAYSDIEEKIDAVLQANSRTPASVGGVTKQSTKPNLTQAEAEELTNSVAQGEENADGPISEAINTGNTSADSVPVPLMILVGLALVLLAAGAAGFGHRKLAARRSRL